MYYIMSFIIWIEVNYWMIKIMKKKISNYVEVIPYKGEYVLYNKINGILVTLENEYIQKKSKSYNLDTQDYNIYKFLDDNDFFVTDSAVRDYISNYAIPREIGESVNVVISLTEKCNCSCNYCYQFDWDKNNSMSETNYYNFICDYLKNVIDKMKLNGVLTIKYFGGEPMLRKEMILKINSFIFAMIKNQSKAINVNFEMDTNYTIMDRDFILKFPNLSISTCLSMPEDHNRLRCNTFARTFKNILATKDVFNNSEYKLNIGYNVHDGNVDEFESFLKLISKNRINCSIYFTNIVNYKGTPFYNNLSNSDFERVSFNTFYPLLYKYGFSIKELLPTFGLVRGCSGYDELSVKLYSNGVISMCSLFGKDLKNVETKDGKVNPLRLNKLPKMCVRCYDYPYCGGLRPCMSCNGIYKDKNTEILKIIRYLEISEGE